MLGATILAAMTFGILATSITLAANQITARGQDLAIRQSDQAYTGLLAEVDDYFQQFRDSTSTIASDQANALGLHVQPGTEGGQMSEAAMQVAAASNADLRSDSEDDARRVLRVSLQQKLRSFDNDLQQIAARNQSLHEQVVNLSETVSGLRHKTEALQKDNTDLTRELASRNLENGALTAELKAINAELWMVEDAIRDKDRAGAFDAEFIALARAVYRRNDARGQAKKKINQLLNSELAEEKSYREFQGP